MYYFNARWYDAQTGRFISEDPARDGSNWHVYVSNNPLKFIDPSGLRQVEGSQDEEKEERPEKQEPKESPEEEIEDIDPDAPLNQNDPLLADIPYMGSDGCNFRAFQNAPEFDTGRNLSPEQIKDSVKTLQSTPDRSNASRMVLDEDMTVNNPDQVMDDAYDRLGEPNTTATAGYGNGDPDFYRRRGTTPLGNRHSTLLNNKKEFLNDPYHPDIPLTNVNDVGIWINRR